MSEQLSALIDTLRDQRIENTHLKRAVAELLTVLEYADVTMQTALPKLKQIDEVSTRPISETFELCLERIREVQARNEFFGS